MHLIPDSSTALGTGCAVLAFGTDLSGRPVWACTLWFNGVVCTAVLTLPEAPLLSELIDHLNRRPSAWQVLTQPKAA